MQPKGHSLHVTNHAGVVVVLEVVYVKPLGLGVAELELLTDYWVVPKQSYPAEYRTCAQVAKGRVELSEVRHVECLQLYRAMFMRA